MRTKLLRMAFIVVVLSLMGPFSSVSAIPPEEDLIPLYEAFSDNRIGNIVIDLVNAHYTTFANVGGQNGKLYYELMAYNPSGVPVTITWGMAQVRTNGNLCFNNEFDSNTLDWIRNYGLNGARYSARPIKPL